MLSPACIRSKPLLMSASGMVWVIIGSIWIFFSMYQSTIFGHVGAAARAAERRALPDAARDQLEGARRDLLAGAGDADDDADAPAAVAGLQRLAHDRDVARAVEGVVGAADLVGALLGHVDEVGDEVAAGLLRVDEVRHAEALAPRLLVVVDVDADDHVGAGELQPLDDVEADAAEAEHDALAPGSTLAVLSTAPMPVVTPQPM